MRIVIAGSSGLIGTALVASLRADGHEVVRLVRRPPSGQGESQWDPDHAHLDASVLDSTDAVVNLCGVGIGDKRWSGSYKQAIRDSRIVATDVLTAAVVRAGVPVLVNAGAVGYYGDTGDTVVDEDAPPGTDFLATVCRDWEAATKPAADGGARVVNLRSGVVISGHGGIIGRLRPLYSFALGGRLGNGRQYFPWISLDDEVAAITFALTTDTVSGPVNLTGPAPVTNAQFNRAMARVLHRPAPWVVPGFVLEAVVGEFAKSGILAGQRAVPAVLESAGFTFRHNTIGEALHASLGR
ncbi:uncharacterized protein (TIGR01777 family) [Rhodococcus sp. 27YEA15]|uniref:TIGR01777 family oxidoreductase n=1 Tax=Rhodococcus sp. 27YEA15 TaxID=3156259 RepID=UPI003C7C69E3